LQCLTEQLSQVRKPDPGREQGLKTMTKSAQNTVFGVIFGVFVPKNGGFCRKCFALSLPG